LKQLSAATTDKRGGIHRFGLSALKQIIGADFVSTTDIGKPSPQHYADFAAQYV
jgi:hypothetical protein